MTTEAQRQRPMRADARRNYERLVSVAETVFAEQGTEASLEEIAKRAGVGIGTLYRHFPTREALLEAVMHDRFESFTRRATELLDWPEPSAALSTYLREFAMTATSYRGLPASVVATLHDETSRLYGSCHALQAAGRKLVERAQRAGVVRSDIEPNEVFVLASSLAWAVEQMPDRADRFLGVLMDGLK